MVAAGPDAAARWGDPPSDNHKLGIRMLLKMPENLGGGVREAHGHQHRTVEWRRSIAR